MAEDEEEKTEEPTGKRLSDAKEEGNVPKSAEVPGAVILIFASIYLLFFSSDVFIELKKMMLYIFSSVGKEIDATVIYTITHTIIFNILYTLIPFFILVLLLAIVSNVAQFGFIAVPIKFNLQKLDPITGVKNIFSDYLDDNISIRELSLYNFEDLQTALDNHSALDPTEKNLGQELSAQLTRMRDATSDSGLRLQKNEIDLAITDLEIKINGTQRNVRIKLVVYEEDQEPEEVKEYQETKYKTIEIEHDKSPFEILLTAFKSLLKGFKKDVETKKYTTAPIKKEITKAKIRE